eukprot:gene34226-biopygen21365
MQSAGSAEARGVGERLEVFWPLDDAWYPGTAADISATGRHHIEYDGGEEEWLLLSEELTRGVGRQQADDVVPGREWLPAEEVTVPLYIAALLERGGIQATSLQPYLSAINNYHEDMGFPGLAKGRAVSRVVKGMAGLQVAASQAAGKNVSERTWLPAKPVRMVHEAALTLFQKGATTCARAVGLAMEKVCFLGGWSQLSAAVQSYINPTAEPNQAMRSYFGWLAPSGVCAQERR